jgi:hypothetical protein
MRGREAVRFHLFHGFLGGPSLFGHSIRCDHHSGAVIASLTVDKNLLAAVIAEQSKESGDVCVFWMEAIQGIATSAFKVGYLFALDFAVWLARAVHYDADAHLSQSLKSLLQAARRDIQSRAHLTEIRYALNASLRAMVRPSGQA